MARLSSCFALLLSAVVAVQASPVIINQHQVIQKGNFNVDPICANAAIQIVNQLQSADRELQLIQQQFGRNIVLNRVIQNAKGGILDARKGIDEVNVAIKQQIIVQQLDLGKKDLAVGLNRAKDAFKLLRTNHRGVNRRINRAKNNLRDSVLAGNLILAKCGGVELKQTLTWDVPSLTLTGNEPEETGKNVEVILTSVGSGVIAEPTDVSFSVGEPLQTAAPSEGFDINTCPPPVTVTVTAPGAEITGVESVSVEVTETLSAEESQITDTAAVETESVTESVGEGAVATESVTESVGEGATATESVEDSAAATPTAAALVGADSYRRVGPNRLN